MGTPVAGPGPYARRTDRQPVRELPATEYGERQETTDIQSAAPMAADQGGNVNFSDLFGSAAGRVVPFEAESSMPDTPVTDGADLGPGQGSSVLNTPSQAQSQKMIATLTVLEWMANTQTSDSARNLVRRMKGLL